MGDVAVARDEAPFESASPQRCAAARRTGNAIDTGLIRSVDGLRAIAGEWAALWREGTPRSPFCEPTWNLAYLDAFEPTAKLAVVTARSEGRLIGLLPLVCEQTLFDGLPARVWRAAMNYYYYRFEVLRCSGALGEAAMAAMWRHLRSLSEWDVISLRHATAPGAADVLFTHARADGWLALRHDHTPTLFVPLPGTDVPASSTPWQATATASLRYQIRRATRRVEEQLGGKLVLDRIDRPDRSQLQRFYDIEASGWKGRQGTAIRCSPASLKFYNDVADAFGRNDGFALHFLRVGDTTLAGSYSLICDRRIYALKWSYQEAFARCSPGHLLTSELLRESWERGMRELDFGPDATYKREWTTHSRQQGPCLIFQNSLYGRLLYAYKAGLRSVAHRVLERIAELRSQKNGEL